MKITVYSKSDCIYCVRAKELLNLKGLTFSEHMVGSDITRDEFLKTFPGAKTVPQIVIDGSRVGGYDQLTEWMKKYDQAKFLTERQD